MPDIGVLQAIANGGSTVLLLAAFWALYTGKFRTRQEVEGLAKEHDDALRRMDERIKLLMASQETVVNQIRESCEREAAQIRADAAERIEDMAHDRDFYRSNLIRALSATQGSVELTKQAVATLEKQTSG